jgi:hypothetical protein
VIRRHWSRLGMTPRLSIVIVLALVATKLLDVLLVALIPPPTIQFYTQEWLTDEVAGAVQLIERTPPAQRERALQERGNDWLRYSVASQSHSGTGEDMVALGSSIGAKLGRDRRRVVVRAEPLTDPDRAMNVITVVLTALPAKLTNLDDDNFERDVIVASDFVISVQLADHNWLQVTEAGRDRSVARGVRNLAVPIGGLALICGPRG